MKLPRRQLRLPAPSVHRTRGSVYVLVLGVSTLITIVGVSAIALAQSTSRVSSSNRDWADAGVSAQAGIELMIAELNTSATWRSDFKPMGPIGRIKIGRALVEIRIDDPVDGDFTENPLDPVRIYSTATIGNATRCYSVEALPTGKAGLDVLRCAIHGASVTVSADIKTGDGPVSSNSWVSNTGGARPTIDVEADTVSSNGYINGVVLTGQPEKTVPGLAPWDALVGSATTINFASLPDGEIRGGLLAPSANSIGAPSNPRGIFRIDVPSTKTLLIQNSRISATLLVNLNTGSQVRLTSSVNWEPADPDLPALIVRGAALTAVNINTSSADLTEASAARNLNPPGAPYHSDSNNDATDSYPSEIRGLIYVCGSIPPVTTLSDSANIIGPVISTGWITATNDNVRVIATPALLNSPPPGFANTTGLIFRPTPGTFRWEVAR